MARQKQAAPLQRATSSELMHVLSEDSQSPDKKINGKSSVANGSVSGKHAAQENAPETPGLMQLAICVLGIYASFLSWGVLQEAITTVSYPTHPPTAEVPEPPTERFTYSIVLNTIQSTFAAITGFLYLFFSTPSGQKIPSPFPTKKIVFPLLLVSISSSLASPFGYASLAHIDYLTFILAKSCKLLPVMFLHLTIFRKRYPLYKYGVVLLVTLGVATFTLHHPGTSKKVAASAAKGQSGSSTWGIFLLSINLLLDGLTNTTQDHVFSSPQLYTRFTGPQMMVAQNVLSTVLTSSYLLIMPHLSSTGILHNLLPFPIPPSTETELNSAIGFLSRHPEALKNVLGFAACGAIGQLFIFYTLSRFSSLLLVTVTVTRKMLTMLLSVFWFGHSLSAGQWLGVGLVFGGIGAEAIVQRQEKAAKERAKAAKKQ
ncbi:UDP-galactose transporter homolog 1 [Aspergillus awamori]|uniref:UDP-galactose transporter homolog 1 n=2 Tax=Aspergillus TaxID=5052 RepID=A0A3F3PJV0_9EURO|nr:UDP-Glc/Gal endoplasmic reticulum nucleotide sugar transporter [Aspergillus welwitschiae]GCB22132.1 UDP-galactose transporter homolog 1 [Aspergillus awamori]GKZ53427.1 UDP-galactose transporter [Aspergillus niger]RDH27215.1 UDP-Glc/Gal endoplasmic reticulum nucleotide sugar transporter [Aspergillus welwitschiae]GKZ65350.1 UDP-galactose transporter [Aspergillus niger]GKZ99783.1 UDP-galactose transporter [Aspergillus niger]